MGKLDNAVLMVRGKLIRFSENIGETVMGRVTGQESSDLGGLTNTVSDAGNGVIFIVSLLLAFVAIIGLILVVLKGIIGGSQAQAEAKTGIPRVIIYAIIGFGAAAIIGFAATFAKTLFSAG